MFAISRASMNAFLSMPPRQTFGSRMAIFFVPSATVHPSIAAAIRNIPWVFTPNLLAVGIPASSGPMMIGVNDATTPKAHCDIVLYSAGMVGELKPRLDAAPDVRIYEAA